MSENRETELPQGIMNPVMDMDRTACYRAISTRDARFDGRLFVGVKTTGIYCRPICPARTPKFENTLFFASAAAAQEAGFRPCLRCRPEISPELAFWRGTSNTVSRALALIEAGGLDDDDVEGLANRLGVGARQLRRLFRQHVGASPVTVAQTRRVLLAKQLIHETSLPMAEVALAAGFNSVRRFNETFRQLFGRPPATLRRSRDKVKREAGVLSVRLAYRPPYDWDAMLSFLGHRAIPGVELVAGDSYRRSIRFGDNSGVVTVTPAGNSRVIVAIRFPDMAVLPQIVARVRRVFDLAADPDTIGAHLALDPMLAPLVAARPGLRVPGAWDGFELAVRAIFGQQITVPAATRLLGRLVEQYGAPLPAAVRDGEGLSHLFPSPAGIAGANLATLGMPAARALAVTSLAKVISTDPSIFSRGASLDDAIAKLRSLPGIGEWTAQYIAMRELREPDAFPAADAGLLRAMAAVEGRRPSPAELSSRAERWRPWRAYAALHLWAACMPPKVSAEKVMSAKPPETFSLDRMKTPIGDALLVTDADGVLRAFDWEDHAARIMELLRLQYGAVVLRDARAPETIKAALSGYFDGDLAALKTIQWRVAGTPFQRKVWTALPTIPPGATMSYGALAARLGMPKAGRALGHANGSNPLSVVVPCHRLIGANGALVKYGSGLQRKRWLLVHEGVDLAPA